jgi:hypothetical protein
MLKHVVHALSIVLVQHVILLSSVEMYTGRASVWEVSLFMQGELHYYVVVKITNIYI